MNIIYRDMDEHHFDIVLGNKMLCTGSFLPFVEEESPRELCDTATTIYTALRRYESIDKPRHLDRFTCNADVTTEIRHHLGIENEPDTAIDGVAYIWPVQVYIHSAISFSLSHGYPYSCPWDAGTCGFAFVDKKQARKAWPAEKHIRKFLYERTEQELDVYNRWANGYPEGYQIMLETYDGIVMDSWCDDLDNKEQAIMDAVKQAAIA